MLLKEPEKTLKDYFYPLDIQSFSFLYFKTRKLPKVGAKYFNS